MVKLTIKWREKSLKKGACKLHCQVYYLNIIQKEILPRFTIDGKRMCAGLGVFDSCFIHCFIVTRTNFTAIF